MPSQLKYKIANASGIPKLVNTLNRRKLLVLTYHGIYDDHRGKQMPPTFVHINDMVAQLKDIKNRCCIITPNELLKHLESGTPLPFNSVLITFDDGYESFARLAEPVLNSLGIKAVVFIPTRYVEKQIPFWFDLVWLFLKQITSDKLVWIMKALDLASNEQKSSTNTALVFDKMKRMLPEKRDIIVTEISRMMSKELNNCDPIISLFYSMTENQLKKLSNRGTIFGGHTHTHTILSSLPLSSTENEILMNKEKLETILDKPCSFFAYPNGGKGDFNGKHKEILKNAGYKAAFSLTQKRSSLNADIMEISRIHVAPEDDLGSLAFRCTGITPLVNYAKTFRPSRITPGHNMEKHNTKSIWIAWERHRRTIELNKVFSNKLFILESRWPRVIKYPILSLKTWKLLNRELPSILLVQNPSIVLTFLAVLLKPVYKYKLIVDAHNAGVMPAKNVLNPLKMLYNLMLRKADVTIVTNEGLAEFVRKKGGNPYILPDRIPETPTVTRMELGGKAAILYICTFEDDEPYLEAIKAAKILGEDVYIYVTGDCNKNQRIVHMAPSNVIFTGYLPEEKYWRMLHSVNLTLDLTLRENCLVCGAYESVSAGTPMVLSDTEVLRNYFYKGAVFSLNDAGSIANAIQEALQKENFLKKEIKEFKREVLYSWGKRATKILQYLK